MILSTMTLFELSNELLKDYKEVAARLNQSSCV